MKKLLLLVALLAVAAIPSVAQGGVTLKIDGIPGEATDDKHKNEFSNNAGPGGLADQQLRIVNFGLNGTPLTSPVGDVCANIYVFDANQEMVACCSCRITPNGLRTISVANNLTNNPVTSVVPVNGDYDIVSTSVGSGTCSPLNYNGGLLDSIVAFGTHLQTSGGTAAGTFITETNIPSVHLTEEEAGFFIQACQFARYLGSGKGVCTCGTGS